MGKYNYDGTNCKSCAVKDANKDLTEKLAELKAAWSASLQKVAQASNWAAHHKRQLAHQKRQNKWLCDQLAQRHAKWHDKGKSEHWEAEARKEQS